MDIENLPLNPIDIVEEVIYQKKWSFSRADEYELVADISSKWCQYRLYFTWSENIRAISFTITFDLKFPQSKIIKAYELIGLINEKLWLGHFDITSKNGIPAFRHTILSNADSDFLHKKLENLVDKLYRENQRMKRRLEKYEGNRRRVNYRNTLTETSKSSNLGSN